MKNLIKLILILIVFNSCSSSKFFTDARDGKKYKKVNIGKQIWMAENLNFFTVTGSWCINDSVSNCNKYGRLYDWEAANAACPSGWHLPSDDEWKIIVAELGGSDIAGGKLKSREGWSSPNKDATDISRFSALPAGYRNYQTNTFMEKGNYSDFWSSTIITGEKHFKKHATYITMTYNYGNAVFSKGYQGSGFSVRCLKNK